MKLSGISARRVSGALAGCVLGGLATAVIAAPSAAAEVDQCSPGELSNTVSTVRGSAEQYLANHPGAQGVLNSAYTQPRPVAAANIRSYFMGNPQEYFELRNILSPIGEAQRACNAPVLSPELASAYSEFMNG